MNLIYLKRANNFAKYDKMIIRPSLLLCDTFYMYSVAGFFLYYHHYFFGNPNYKVDDKMYLEHYISSMQINPKLPFNEILARKVHTEIEKIKKKPYKNKVEIMLLNQYNVSLKGMHSSCDEFYKANAISFGLGEFEPLIEKNVMQPCFLEEFTENNTKEDSIIELISNYISDKQSYLLLDEQIFDSFRDIETKNTEEIEGDTIYYYNYGGSFCFPIMDDKINCIELEYTRNEMKEVRDNWIKSIAALRERMDSYGSFEIAQSYYKAAIKELLEESREAYINKFNDCVYMRQFDANGEDKVTMINFIMLVSVEGLINAYVKAQIMLPYVATQVKERLKRSINMDAPLLLFLMQKDNEKEEEEEEDEEQELIETNL